MSTKKHFTNAPGGWCRACDHRDYFAEPVLGPRGARTRGLAMIPQMAVIARSGATKQFRCEARWRESSVWFRPLGTFTVTHDDVAWALGGANIAAVADGAVGNVMARRRHC